MPPKKPVQAGKFKPLKRPTKKAASAEPSTSTDNAAAAATSSSTDVNPSSSTTTATNSRSRSPKGGRGDGGGRGGGRGRGGRGGRGKFIAPTGQAFFTGNAIAGGSTSASAAAGARAARGGGPVDISGATSATTQKYNVTRNAAAAESAAAKAREGEGEEIVVMEMDLEDGEEEGGKKKKSVLEQDRPEREGPSLFDNEDIQETPLDADAYEYDSDSSIEEQKQRRKGNVSNFRMAPIQLPFPVAPHQQSMYDCQGATTTSLIADKKKSSDVEMSTEQQSSSILSDPELESPFIDVTTASEDLKQLELNSWFLMKFPTRLPHLDNSGGGDSKPTNVNSEMSEGDEPDLVGSSNDANDTMMPATVSVGAGPSSATGYDDTLKDIPPCKYGRIVVRKSGRTELIVGGGDSGEPEVRMLIHEGLQCGFRQEAVSIDPDEATFITLGNVNKSIVVTPDIEQAFAFS